MTILRCVLLCSLVASCCYKVMENPGAMKEKSLKEEMFHVLGLLVQKYNQMLSECCTRC